MNGLTKLERLSNGIVAIVYLSINSLGAWQIACTEEIMQPVK